MCLNGASGTLCARTHGLKGLKAGETMDLFRGLKGMALNLVTDNMGVVVFGDVRAIIRGDTVKCAGAPFIIPRQSLYEPMKTGLKEDTARASAVTCTALAPVNEHGTPVPAVTYAAPAPVTDVQHVTL